MSTWSAHTCDSKERPVHSYLEGEAMRMSAEIVKARETLPPLMSLIFIGGTMDIEFQAHMLHPAVDVAF